MKRFAIAALIVATTAVAYAAVGDRLAGSSLFNRFRASRRLPSLRSAEMPFKYPAHLWREGVEGEVLLKVHITSAGSVDSVLLEQSSGSPELDSVALKGARELMYHPARQGEISVAVWAQLPVRFQRRFSDPAAEDGG